MKKHPQLTEARELLPWYVNNTLSEVERKRVESELAKNEVLRAELAWLKGLQTEVKNTGMAKPQQGVEKLMQRIAADRIRSGGISNRNTTNWLRPAFAIAATLLVVQTFVLSYILIDRESVLQPLSGPSTQAVLQVTFRPGVTEQQLREILALNQAEIVSGPGSLGVYGIKISPDKVQQVMTDLRNKTDIVESVQAAPQ